MAEQIGFLNLTELLEIQKSDKKLFSIPKDNTHYVIPNKDGLSSQEIEKKIEEKQQERYAELSAEIESEIQNQIDKNKGVALDLRLGDEYYLSGESYTSSAKNDHGVHIQPGQFALLTTYEIFHMPRDLVGFVSMRFGIKAEGLINVSGFQVDPGYQGIFTFSVYNAGPREINLEYKKKIFTVIFAKTSSPIKDVRNDVILNIDFDKWTKLKDKKSLSIIQLDERLGKLEFRFGLAKYIAPAIAATAAILGYFIGAP